jgi:putative drug exporter of the RND superfamily
MLASWGIFVHRHRWAVLVLSVLSSGASLWVIGQGGQFDSVLVPSDTESGRALALLQRDLPRRPLAFDLVFGHPTLTAAAPAFQAEVERAVAPLRSHPRVTGVRTAWDATPPAPERLSRDGRHTRVTVELLDYAAAVESMVFAAAGGEAYAELRPLVSSNALTVTAAGALALHHDFTEFSRRDVVRAELVILPVVPVLLLFVFGSVVAAAVPVGVGLLAVAGGMAGTLLLARATSVSVYAPNVVTMIGLAVAIDYSLFIVSRYREEIRVRPMEEALGRTMATAGLAILFSGLTVAVGLLGLYSLRLGNLGSIGLCGTVVVGLSVLYGLTFLPALLAVLGRRVDAWRLPLPGRDRTANRRGMWVRLTTMVMGHPWQVLVPVAAVLLLLGAPFARIRLASSGEGILPPGAESRRGGELERREFSGQETTRILVVLDWGAGSPLAAPRIAELYGLSRWLAAQPDVRRVESFVDLDPSISLGQYQMLAASPAFARPPTLQGALSQTVGHHMALLVVHTPHPASSETARSLVRRIRQEHPPGESRLLITGHTAFDLDFLGLVRDHAPRAVVLIVTATYLVLFLLLGSILLPIKAVLMNFLSISASYGALVWIFQDGHLADWLHFTPGPIETATPLIMFCVIFGLSMDYGVLLLSRIREEYQRTGDNTLAVGAGLEHTGRLITAAAAIMAAVFFGFAMADLVVIKAIGIGMGIAVVLDATIVRALLVPATMRLLGRWNWWAPAPLARWHARVAKR